MRVLFMVLCCGACAAALGACRRFDPLAAPLPFVAPVLPIGAGGVAASTAPASAFPVFDGVGFLLGMDGGFRAGWPEGRDDVDPSSTLVYEIYDAPIPAGQDFLNPLAVTSPGASHWDAVGLANGIAHHVVVRVRDGSGNLDRNRVELTVFPAPIVYVDGSAIGAVQDGTTPRTPVRTISQGLSRAAGLGGANLWIAEGTYEEALVLPDLVALYGGFDSSFDPDLRDPTAHLTRILVPVEVSTAVDASPLGTLRILDGLAVRGLATTKTGVRIEQGTVVLANVTVVGFGGRGVRVSGPLSKGFPGPAAVLHRTRVAYQGQQGILLSGFANLDVVGCTVDHNGTGIRIPNLMVPEKGSAAIRIQRSRITGNTGLGVHVNYLGFGGGASNNGKEVVLVSNCFVARNGGDGIRLDIDFDQTGDQVKAQGIVDHTVVRDNRGGGITLDIDRPSLFEIASTEIFGNAAGGVASTAEIDPGILRLVHGVIWGNRGPGIYALAPVQLAVMQSAVLWNMGAGVSSDGTGAFVAGSVLAGNVPDVTGPSPEWSIVRDGSPGPGNLAGDPGFTRAPLDLVLALAGTTSSVALSDPSSFFAGDTVEIDGDGVARTATSFQGSTMVFDPPAAAAVAPGVPVTTFGPGGGGGVNEDWTLAPGSAAIDAGHPALVDPDGSPADIGPFGGPAAGPLPGIDLARDLAQPGFAVVDLSTPFSGPIGSGDPVLFTLNAFVDPATIDAQSVRVVADGQIVPAAAEGVGPFVTVTPQGSIPSGAIVEIALSPPLASSDGRLLAAAWIARFVAP